MNRAPIRRLSKYVGALLLLISILTISQSIGVEKAAALAKFSGQSVVTAAASQAGMPYCFAGGNGSGPTHGSGGSGCGGGTVGFDCTGLTLYAIYQASGGTINLPHSGAQATAAVADGGQSVSEANLQPGDLVYFGGSFGSFDHSGVYAGGGAFWDANDYNVPVQQHTMAWEEHGLPFVGAVRLWSPSGGGSGGGTDLLSDGSFQNGAGGWSVGAGTNFTTYSNGAVPGTNAYEGTTYGATNASATGGSIYQIIPATISAGQSYCASLEAVTLGGTGGSGVLSLWLTGGGGNENSTYTFWSLPGGNSWTPGSTCMTATTSHTAVEVQYYPSVGSPTVGLDAVETQAKGFGVGYPALSITSSTLPNGKVGASYSVALTSAGGAAPDSWSIASGSLPSGLTLSSNGVITGTPTSPCTCTFSIRETDSSVETMASSKSFSLTVDESPAITSASSGTFVVGSPGAFEATATGTPAPTLSETGALPSGVTFTDGVLSGTPAPGTAGTYPITLMATNGIAPDATQDFTLTVLPIGITTTSLPNGSVYSKTNKVLYSVTVAASGGNLPYKWSLASGSNPLPPGLKLSSKGVISGKATTAGTYSFTVQVVDKKTKAKPPTQNKATATLSITIGQ